MFRHTRRELRARQDRPTPTPPPLAPTQPPPQAAGMRTQSRACCKSVPEKKQPPAAVADLQVTRLFDALLKAKAGSDLEELLPTRREWTRQYWARGPPLHLEVPRSLLKSMPKCSATGLLRGLNEGLLPPPPPPPPNSRLHPPND